MFHHMLLCITHPNCGVRYEPWVQGQRSVDPEKNMMPVYLRYDSSFILVLVIYADFINYLIPYMISLL